MGADEGCPHLSGGANWGCGRDLVKIEEIERLTRRPHPPLPALPPGQTQKPYFATQVDNFIADEKIIEAPSKGTEKTMVELTKSIKESTAQWGDFAQRILWYINI